MTWWAVSGARWQFAHGMLHPCWAATGWTRPATCSEDAIPWRSCRGCRRDMRAGSERHDCRPYRARDFLPGWSIFGSHMHGGSVAGVFVLLSPALAGIYTIVRLDIVIRGRILVLRLRAEGCPAVDVANIDLVEAADFPVHAQLLLLRRSLSPVSRADHADRGHKFGGG